MESHRQRARAGGGVAHGGGIYRPLPRSFYARPVHAVARDLIGTLLVRRDGSRLRVARIVEVEAYAGRLDPASHSFRGPTPRCATMFGPLGRLYVYFTYGAHFCVNVVAGSRRDAAAVLLRSAEPREGIEAMRAGRLARTKPGATADALARGDLDDRLASGPGNLAAAFSFAREHDGVDLTRAEIAWIAADPARKRVTKSVTREMTLVWTPRIGLSSPLAGVWLWRCADPRSAAPTRIPTAWPRAAAPTPTIGELRLSRGAAPSLRAASPPRAPRETRRPRSRRE
jgi:DNA-3-methyladenine glycosylase